MRIVRRASYKSSPWKNGGGITHEAIREPASTTAFRYRLSVAHIDASGPFSDFAGYRRIMVLLRGAGVMLRFGVAADKGAGAAPAGERTLSAVGEQIEFDGGLAASCELLNGPCVDLNLMVAQSLGAVAARVERLGAPYSLDPGPDRVALVFPIDAPLEAAKSGARLEPWDVGIVDAEACTLVPPRAQPTLVFIAALSRG